MRFIKTISFKPKTEHINNFLKEYNRVIEKAYKNGSIDSYFTAIIEDEIFYVGTFNEKEKTENVVEKGLEWLHEYKHMLEPYSNNNSYAIVKTGKISKENLKNK